MVESSKINQRIEEAILIIIILLQVLDFFERLPGDFDYAKKIISWSLLGYLVYKINLTQIMFGRKQKSFSNVLFGMEDRDINLLIIIAYFLLITKNIVSYSIVAEGKYISGMFHFIASNAALIELFSVYMGGMILILLSFYLALTSEIKKPSLMHVIHEEGEPPKTTAKFMTRFLTIFIVLVFFFIIVFNLMMEWLAIAVDAPLVMIAILFYIFIVVRHYRKLSTEALIYKIGEVGDKFYERFISLFQYKNTIFLGFSAMLILHLLTDIGNFIVPYIFARYDVLYFGNFNPAAHQSFIHLFLKDFSLSTSLLGKLSLAWAYVFNILAALLLLALPSYIWYKLYKKEGFKVSHIALSIFFICICVLLMSPLLTMSPIYKEDLVRAEGSIVGVDFMTRSASGSNVSLALVVSVMIGFIIYLLSYSHRIKEKLLLLAITIVDSFFALYVFYFFISIWRYYIDTIIILIRYSQFFIGVFMLLFFTITIFFYVAGLLIFIIETKKEFRYIR